MPVSLVEPTVGGLGCCDHRPAILEKYPDLNDAQREIVPHGEGPLLVMAGPGSGKTYSIVFSPLKRPTGSTAVPSEHQPNPTLSLQAPRLLLDIALACCRDGLGILRHKEQPIKRDCGFEAKVLPRQ
jgi:hypothetical protein